MCRLAMLQGFESNALGAFGGGPESTEAWRKRVDAQDAFSAAAAAKSAALHRKEEALVARRATLAQLEAAVNAVTAEEALASASAAAAQAALGDLEAHAQVSFASRPVLPADSPLCWPPLWRADNLGSRLQQARMLTS